MPALNSAPFELIAQPADIWLAPFGTAFPDPWQAPAAPWEVISVGGSRSLGESGVSVAMSQDIAFHRTAGTTAPVKASRQTEDLVITATVHDMTIESFARALGKLSSDVELTPADTTTPGVREVSILRGIDMRNYALLVRFASPYEELGVAQFQVPNVVMAGSPDVVFSKGELAGIEIAFTAIEDVSNPIESERFGKLVATDSRPTG